MRASAQKRTKKAETLWTLVRLEHFEIFEIQILFANSMLNFLVVCIVWQNAYARLLNSILLRDLPWPYGRFVHGDILL